jgi:hypothetical protein
MEIGDNGHSPSLVPYSGMYSLLYMELYIQFNLMRYYKELNWIIVRALINFANYYYYYYYCYYYCTYAVLCL